SRFSCRADDKIAALDRFNSRRAKTCAGIFFRNAAKPRKESSFSRNSPRISLAMARLVCQRGQATHLEAARNLNVHALLHAALRKLLQGPAGAGAAWRAARYCRSRHP